MKAKEMNVVDDWFNVITKIALDYRKNSPIKNLGGEAIDKLTQVESISLHPENKFHSGSSSNHLNIF